MQFVHLHLHSEYSLLDGACRIKDLVAKVKELGQTAVAVTDHGNLYAAIDFYNEAKANGIKPVIGCEVYVAPRSRFDKMHGVDSKPYHLILLCENNEGYRNLVKIVSLGYTEGFYNKPRTDPEVLRKYHKGLIAMSACIAGEIPSLLLDGDYSSAKAKALEYNEIFGQGNYFIEVQNHGIREEMAVLPLLYKLSAETGIPLCATNDAHYIAKEDAKVQKVLIAIQTNTPLSSPSPLNFPTNEFYIKSYGEMSSLFGSVPEALENTVRIAERCNVEFEFGKVKLPKYKADGIDDNAAYLREMCREGLSELMNGNIPEEYVSRLDYELDVIEKMGFADYYLIVWDFVNYAKTHDIPVGPGRGSGAGSLAAYSIGITGIDPMKYSLLFERFLNPERVSMPDFDIDFCYEKRQQVIDYVVSKYGEDRVSQIITFGTMAAKAAVKDVGRVMELPYQLTDTVSKLIPFDIHGSLDKALDTVSDLKSLYMSDDKVHELIDTAKKIEGMPRHASTHAAGVVISDAPVSDYVPVQKNDEALVTQYPMKTLESLGLVKMDFLGLRTLTVISDTAKAVKAHCPDFDIESIPLDDKDVYEMLSAGDTEAVFQFESAGMRQVLSQLKPGSVEDLIAVLSLYRPGPMESIPKYIENRHHPERVTYKHPLLEDILNVTYGCIVYQEQVMQICRKLAGYSYGRADLVRRAMAKKKASEMEKERSVFVEGAVKNGVPEKTADEIFDEMSGFASYAFNKSHAAAYSYVAYQTAYLKCHYFKEYMAALMTSVLDWQGKLSDYISGCERRGIRILKPDINMSMPGFSAEGEGIRFALLAVRNLGRNAIENIVSERSRNGAFSSLADFCRRMNGRDINRKAAESLIKCGAFDCFRLNRRQMLDNYDRIFSELQASARQNIEGQINFFESSFSGGAEETVYIPNVPEYDLARLLEFEKEASGMYISGHPLQQYRYISRAARHTDVRDITGEERSLRDGAEIKLIFLLREIKLHKTKTGASMAFLTAEDMTGECEMILFPEAYAMSVNLLKTGAALYAEGKLSQKDESPKIIAERLMSAERYSKVCKSKCLYIKCRSDSKEQIDAAVRICGKHAGSGKINLYFEDLKKYVKPKSITGVDISEELLKELYSCFEEGNIAVS